MSSKRKYQKQHADKYIGGYAVDASHGISVNEMNHFGVSCDFPSNYRNCNQFTNRSVHNRIDNMFLQAHTSRQRDPFTGISYQSNGSQHYISPQEMVDRLQWKINVAKETGSIHNPRMGRYLYTNANRLGMDMRMFNGYNW